jgi:RNA polymerase subunit RPABC4/transcription elongation factor Spt4
MNNLVDPQRTCPRCSAVLDATDKYCRHCGASLAVAADTAADDVGIVPVLPPDAGRTPAPVSGPASPLRLRESPWLILPLLFLLLGPLAFGMLWRSRQFSRPWKIIFTIVVTGLTVWACWRLWLVFQQLWALVQQEQQLMENAQR